MFTSIVVALDLEREGDRALHIFGSLSALTAMTVELLTVASPGIPEEADAFELRRRATANGWPADCYTILHDDDPARAIADHVNARPGALLIMSTTAKSPLRRRFLGSVSEAVLSRVHGPVLLVGPHVPADADMSRPTLVACVDSTDAATRALPVITAWARTFTSATPWVVEVLSVPFTKFGVGRDMASRPMSTSSLTSCWPPMSTPRGRFCTVPTSVTGSRSSSAASRTPCSSPRARTGPTTATTGTARLADWSNVQHDRCS